MVGYETPYKLGMASETKEHEQFLRKAANKCAEKILAEKTNYECKGTVHTTIGSHKISNQVSFFTDNTEEAAKEYSHMKNKAFKEHAVLKTTKAYLTNVSCRKI